MYRVNVRKERMEKKETEQRKKAWRMRSKLRSMFDRRRCPNSKTENEREREGNKKKTQVA